jgi:hypothetical protein
MTEKADDENPACDDTGQCAVPLGARLIASCVYCGKELHEDADGQWFTWDAYKHANPRPQRKL